MKKKSSSVYYYQTRGCWVASFTGKDGKRKVKRLPLAGNIDEAAEEFVRLHGAETSNEPRELPETPLKPMLSMFERQVMSEMRPSTQCIYRQVFNLLTEANIKDVKALRPDKLSALRDVFLRHEMGKATQHKLLRATKRLLRWSNKAGFTSSVVDFDMPRLRKKSKGRPLTEAEFKLMLKATDQVYAQHPDRAKACRRLLCGLWLSGLRISECTLSWDDKEAFHVDWQSHKNPVFVMPDEMDKTGQARVFPMAPEFWALISSVPVENRTGPVFQVLSTRVNCVLNTDQLSKLIFRIGKLSGVIVDRRPDGTVKYASAHDLRRSFGLRWASRRINEMQLGALMRHSSSETTRAYYIGNNASAVLDEFWDENVEIVKQL